MKDRPKQVVHFEFGEVPPFAGSGTGTMHRYNGEWVAADDATRHNIRVCDRAVMEDGTLVKNRYPESRPKVLSLKLRECSLKEFDDGYDLLVNMPSEAGHDALATALQAGYGLLSAGVDVHVVIEIADHPEAAFYAERLTVGKMLHGIRSKWVRTGLGTKHSEWDLRLPIQSVEFEDGALRLVLYRNRTPGVTIGLNGELP